ncbi:ATP-binding protein [Chlorogloea sp. CCALA 695]|uniref:ATP-binding protein n=1 Tax=Chlorogloea sp. CCALA 695 TaxID=2107693 RepID=UPI000D076AD2|nr:ATP-binding protein [Chlorogloea sp. CCALA 695]PSB30839.1 AAA family ATPase [Chlorogloea sp. CCALA 695]
MTALEELLSRNYPIVACESPIAERQRFFSKLVNYGKAANIQVFLWNLNFGCVKKLTNGDDNKLLLEDLSCFLPVNKQNRENYFEIFNFWRAYKGTGILIIENIYPWLKESETQDTDLFLVCQWLKSAIANLELERSTGKTAILLGPSAEITGELGSIVPLWVQELPETKEIVSNLIASNIFPSLNPNEWEAVAVSSAGLYIADIISCLEAIKIDFPAVNSSELPSLMLGKKTQLLKRLYDCDFVLPSLVELGGLQLMQESFKRFKALLAPRAKEYNLRVPKGILLVGPPGTGKSHSAKACSQNMNIPLIMIDWGNFRSFGNLAEIKLKRLFALADRLNQVIVYFDDFDKSFAGDDPLAKRLAGQLLTWMQERQSDVLVMASVNRMEWLPPELTRAGRFDYLFKIDLPNEGERHHIFKIHASRFDKRFANGGDPWSDQQWRRILKETKRCVGSEIQTIVERAAASIFAETIAIEDNSNLKNFPLMLSVEAIIEERRQIKPLAIREADRVESMRNKADAQALPSSPIDDSKFAIGDLDIFNSIS